MNLPNRKISQGGPIRVGQINFTNVWPVSFFFSEQLTEPCVEIVTSVPTRLNEAMRNKQLDMGPISSFAYGVSADEYVLLPDLSVSAYGEVGSILLFLRKPLDERMPRSVALPTTSATSINLLKIILETFYGASPDYFTCPPQLDAMMRDHDAALLIGDDAIRASWSNRGEYEVVDLGDCWRRFTGESMTFAVWAVREETARAYPERLSVIHDAYRRSKQLAKANLSPLVAKAVQTVGGTPEYWRGYFSGLIHDFGQREQNGLQLYFRYAKQLGLLQHDVPLRIWSGHSVAQVKE